MFQNHPVSPSYSINSNINSFNYYQQQMTSIASTNLGDSNWLGWPIWIPTDTIVTIGERQFHAHRSVLGANSGYFRSEFSSNSIQTDKQATKSTTMTPVWDSENVLDVLSAAQILLMPRVIELCRGYLLQRHLTSCLSDFYSTNRNFPASSSHFHMSINNPETTSAFYPTCNSDRSVNTFLDLNRQQSDQFCSTSSTASSSHRIIRPIPSKYPYNVLPLVTSATSSTISTASEIRSSTPPSVNNTHDIIPDNAGTSSASKTDQTNLDEIPKSTTVAENLSQTSRDDASVATSNAMDKEFIDVACCDGPVKFQRVLNENCNLVIMMMSGDSVEKTNEKRQVADANVGDVDAEVKSPENFQDKSDDDICDELPPPKTSKRVHYRCVYCRHTYKSLCCYLKHKQRHLNPKSKLGFKVAGDDGARRDEKEKTPESKIPSTTREINVPFYPCRVCGLKFPSYYFVHKHRRACHKMSQSEESNV